MSECNRVQDYRLVKIFSNDRSRIKFTKIRHIFVELFLRSYVRSTEDISCVSTEPEAMPLNRTSSNGTRHRSNTKRNEVSCIHLISRLR